MTVVQYMPVWMMSNSLSTLLQWLASTVGVALQLTTLESYPFGNAVNKGAVTCMKLLNFVCRTDPNIIVRHAPWYSIQA